MRSVILTRPQPCPDELRMRWAQAGVSVLHLPTLSLSAISRTEDEARIRTHWSNYTVAMFVSQHSAEFAHQHMARLGLHWSAAIYLAAVGQGTHNTLRHLWPSHARLTQPAPQDSQDSEGLWRSFNTHPQLTGPQNLLIIRAEQGRNTLLQLAQQAHWQTDVWPCYRRAPRHWNDDEQTQFAHACAQKALLIITSIEGLSALTAQLPPHILNLARQQRIVTLHPRIAHYAQTAGFTDVHLCPPDQWAERIPILASDTSS